MQPPPQQRRSKMIQIQLLSCPQPPPQLPPNPLPLQQQSNKIIQIIELHPLSLPHPQFVAAKSLIRDLQKFYLQFILCESVNKVTKI